MMKKLLSLSAVALMTISCVMGERDQYTEMDRSLAAFSDDKVFSMAVEPVLILSELKLNPEKDILADGFCDESGIFSIVRAKEDSTWTAEQSAPDGKGFTFTTKIRMLPKDEGGMDTWMSCGKGEYDEDNGYTATISTESPAVFSWEKHVNPNNVTIQMVFDGRFTVRTSSEGKEVHSCILEYKKSYAGYTRDYKYEISRLE